MLDVRCQVSVTIVENSILKLVGGAR